MKNLNEFNQKALLEFENAQFYFQQRFSQLILPKLEYLKESLGKDECKYPALIVLDSKNLEESYEKISSNHAVHYAILQEHKNLLFSLFKDIKIISVSNSENQQINLGVNNLLSGKLCYIQTAELNAESRTFENIIKNLSFINCNSLESKFPDFIASVEASKATPESDELKQLISLTFQTETAAYAQVEHLDFVIEALGCASDYMQNILDNVNSVSVDAYANLEELN